MQGMPRANFAIKRRAYTKEELEDINASVNNLLAQDHIDALNGTLCRYFIAKRLTGQLDKDIRKVLLNNIKTVDKFCAFLATLHRAPVPSIPFTDEYLDETLQIKFTCEVLLQETRAGRRKPEDARESFIIEMADLYEKITGEKASHPFQNKGEYHGRFYNFITKTYGPIEQLPPSTLFQATKNALKVRSKATAK